MNEEIDNVNHPEHYTTGFAPVIIECIAVTRHLPFDLGNAFKYVWRAGKKGDKAKAREDLDKALWYLDDYATCADDAKGLEISAANAVFGLLPVKDSARFFALQNIVGGDREEAAWYICQMKRELNDEQN